MVLRIFILVCVAVLTSIRGIAQEPATEIIRNASIEATKANKNILLLFKASWCGWCRKLDDALSDSCCVSYFDRSYIIRRLTVLETHSKKTLENPGAEMLLKQYGGEGHGLPYWVVLDSAGNRLADSRMASKSKNESQLTNTGCPATPGEIEHFVQTLRATSKLNDEELKQIAARFSTTGQR